MAFFNFPILVLSHFHFPPQLPSLESGWRYEGLYQHKREEILCFRKQDGKVFHMGLANYIIYFDTQILLYNALGVVDPTQKI